MIDDGAIRSCLSQSWHRILGGQFWVGYGWGWWGNAATMFALDVLRLDVGRGIELKARAYAACAQSACWWWPHTSFVLVSERPTLIEKNKSGQFKLARWEWTDEQGEAQRWEVKS